MKTSDVIAHLAKQEEELSQLRFAYLALQSGSQAKEAMAKFNASKVRVVLRQCFEYLRTHDGPVALMREIQENTSIYEGRIK